jgi:hypothetical protein
MSQVQRLAKKYGHENLQFRGKAPRVKIFPGLPVGIVSDSDPKHDAVYRICMKDPFGDNIYTTDYKVRLVPDDPRQPIERPYTHDLDLLVKRGVYAIWVKIDSKWRPLTAYHIGQRIARTFKKRFMNK